MCVFSCLLTEYRKCSLEHSKCSSNAIIKSICSTNENMGLERLCAYVSELRLEPSSD